MQIISNLQNDVGYTVRGGETGTRTGLPRATARGWLAIGTVRAAIVLAVLLAVVVGAPLIALRGWPVALIVVSSIVAAYAYMGGPRPIAYTPFGEATVFLFFGVVALVGTIYVQAGVVGTAGWVAGIAFGLLAAIRARRQQPPRHRARRLHRPAHDVGRARRRRIAPRVSRERRARLRRWSR